MCHIKLTLNRIEYNTITGIGYKRKMEGDVIPLYRYRDYLKHSNNKRRRKL